MNLSKEIGSRGAATREDAEPRRGGLSNTPGACPLLTDTDADALRLWLGHGAANATKQSILARSCGWETPKGAPDTRRVQLACTELRAQGTIVASSCSPPYGSYVAVTSEEKGAYKAQIFSRISALIRTAGQVDRAWEAEIADELFHPCRNCTALIGREREYCDTDCRTEYHTRARIAGYASMGGA